MQTPSSPIFRGPALAATGSELHAWLHVKETADKPGSVEGDHSSGTHVAKRLKQPTRIARGPRDSIPIWSCSERGLPCRLCCQNRGALLPHHFTLTAITSERAAVYFLLHFP